MFGQGGRSSPEITPQAKKVMGSSPCVMLAISRQREEEQNQRLATLLHFPDNLSKFLLLAETKYNDFFSIHLICLSVANIGLCSRLCWNNNNWPIHRNSHTCGSSVRDCFLGYRNGNRIRKCTRHICSMWKMSIGIHPIQG